MDYQKWNKIYLFISLEGENPLKSYDYYFKKKDFTKCNYSFIVPEHLSEFFSSFYPKILKDCFIFFPKDFQQSKELIDDYESEAGNEKKWIIISPCVELEKNIKIFHEKESIVCFIGYCPIINHVHDDILYFLPKFYGIFNSSNELIKKLFELSNIFYYRKKNKYELDNNIETLELKNDSKFFIDIKDPNDKHQIILEKLTNFTGFKMNDDYLFLNAIKSFNLLNKYFEEQNFETLYNIIWIFR